MARITLLMMVSAAIIATGCASPVPIADNFRMSSQKVARTAHHWDVVADDVVEQTADRIESDIALKGRPVYVAQPEMNTTFDAAFRDFLITRMVDRGMAVSVCSTATGPGYSSPELQVRYSTKVIQHSANMPSYRPGALTALASGVYVGHQIGQSGLTAAQLIGAGIGLGALIDWSAGHAASATKTEIIVTSTISDNNRFVMRRSDVYYVPDADALLFSQPMTLGAQCGEGPRTVMAPPSELDLEKVALVLRVQSMIQRHPEWHGTVFSYKDFGEDGPLGVRR